MSPAQSVHSLSPSQGMETLSHNGGSYPQEPSPHQQSAEQSLQMGPYRNASQGYCALPPSTRNAVQQQQQGEIRPGLAQPHKDTETPTPSQMMGQLMGALNNSTLLDDLNLNIETLPGFDCNVDEVIKHELSMDGSLDFNFSQHNHHNHGHHNHHHHHHQHTGQPGQLEQHPVAVTQQNVPYTSTVPTGPSWVH